MSRKERQIDRQTGRQTDRGRETGRKEGREGRKKEWWKEGRDGEKEWGGRGRSKSCAYCHFTIVGAKTGDNKAACPIYAIAERQAQLQMQMVEFQAGAINIPVDDLCRTKKAYDLHGCMAAEHSAPSTSEPWLSIGSPTHNYITLRPKVLTKFKVPLLEFVLEMSPWRPGHEVPSMVLL